MVGKHLSHYHITAELGRGGMGIVYRATDTKLDRTVAIKVLPSAALASDVDRARFYREAKAAAALTHPHIAIIHAVDEAVPEGASHGTEPSPFIAMEYIEGETIEEGIEKSPFKLEVAVRITSEIASALELAHENEIVHRDIKPANIMLSEKGGAKVLDFGLAQTAQTTKLTRLGSTLGTVRYMSPEQARGDTVDRRTDIFSLGIVLYEMITGQSPFGAEYEQAIIYNILNQDPEPLTALRTGVPMELERIVEKCLAKDVKRRYQHCDDLIADLEGLDLTATGSGSNARATGTTTKTIRTPAGGWTWPKVLTTIITAIVASVVTWIITTSGESSELRVTSMNRVTFESLTEMYPSISPGGDRIVYAAGKPDDMRLYYRLIDGGPPIRLMENSDRDENYPTYSPDGNRISFDADGSIYSVEALGGVPRPIIRPSLDTDMFEYATWSPDGEEIAFTQNNEQIHILRLGERAPYMSIPFSRVHSLSWSPDGQFLAAVSLNSGHAKRGNNIAPSSIWLLRISDKSTYRITSDEYMDLSPRWSPDGSALFFISNQSGRLDAYRQSITAGGLPAGLPERLTTGLDLFSLDVSKDGSRLLAVELNYRQNIWASDLGVTSSTSAADAIRITSGDQVIEGVAISRDGKRIAFDSNARGLAHLYIMPLSGGMPFQVSSRDKPDFLYDWSPYSDELSFHTFGSGNRDAGIVSESGLETQMLAETSSNELLPFWLIDRNTMAYHVYGASEGENQLLLVRRDSSGTWSNAEVIVEELLIGARWSAAAGLVAYFSYESLYMWNPETRESLMVADVSQIDGISSIRFGTSVKMTWAVDGSTIYFTAINDRGDESFWAIGLDGRSPRKIVDMTGSTVSFAPIAADSHRLYYTLSEIESDIWVLELGKE